MQNVGTMALSPTAIRSSNKGRVLIVGATGFMGKFLAEASLSIQHPTYLLVRPGPLIASKAAIIKTFQDKGARVIYVSYNVVPKVVFPFCYIMMFFI